MPISVPSSSVKSIASSATGRSRPASCTVRSDLERTDDAERAVVPPAVTYRIEVGAEQQRPRSRVAGGEHGGVVGCRVDAGLEARSPCTFVEPRTGGEVRLGERRSLEPAIGCGADPRRGRRSPRAGGRRRREAPSGRCYSRGCRGRPASRATSAGGPWPRPVGAPAVPETTQSRTHTRSTSSARLSP